MNPASADTFVAVVPAPWNEAAAALLKQSYEETWIRGCEIEFDGPAGTLIDEGLTAQLLIEEAIPEMVELAGTSMEPFGPSDVVLLQNHTHVWRVSVPAGEEPKQAAAFFVRIISGFIEAGASGVLIPMTVRLHSPRSIRVLAVDPENEEALANLLVHAWDTDGRMRTRGMTAFGLPEVETPINEGMNAAYFRLMDVAANMIQRECEFMEGSQLQLGPALVRVTTGSAEPADPDVPVAGQFGVQILDPA